MTSDQCRRARELLGWTDVQLATRAGVKPATVRYVEGGNGRPQTRTLFAIRTAFKAVGVDFSPETGASAELGTKSTSLRDDVTT